MLCLRFIALLLLLIGLSSCVPVAQQPSRNKSEQVAVHYNLGVSHLQSRNPTMALKELLIAVESAPDNSGIHASLAQAYQLKKAYQQAERHYLKAISLSDNDPRYQNNLATLYLDMHLWEKAIHSFDQAVANLLFLSPHVALAGKGYAYLQMKDYPAALEQLEEVIAIAPRYARGYLLLSETYQAMGEKDAARKVLEKTLDVAPGNVPALYQLGLIALQEHHPKDAAARFERVVELSPGTEWGLKSAEMLRAFEKTVDAQP